MFYNIKNVILTRKPLFKSQILLVCSHCSPLRTDQSNIFLTYKRYKNKSQAVQRDFNDVAGHFNLMLAKKLLEIATKFTSRKSLSPTSM